MIQLMADIFTENRFHVSNPAFLGEHQGFMAGSADPLKSGFFLVLFETEDVDFAELSEKLEQYFVDLKRLPEGYDRRMDKNFTLILCLKRVALTHNEVLNRRIFELEEDPYHFRKLVLPYTDEEIRDIRAHHTSNGITVGLYSLLNDKEAFFEFKKYPVEMTAYNLTTRLFIKLPFLQYRGVEEDLEVLSTTINERLDALELSSLRKSSLELINSINGLTIDQNDEKITLITRWLEDSANE